MKLKFKNNQWEDENGVPIAPNDQEKVNRRVWELIIEDIDDRSINNKELRKLLPADYDEWIPEIGKLYDSGDLVFEKQWQVKRKNQDNSQWIESDIWPFEKRNLESKIFEYREVWILKDKPKQLSDYRAVTDKVQVEERKRICTYPKHCNCAAFKGCLKPTFPKDINDGTNVIYYLQEIEKWQKVSQEFSDERLQLKSEIKQLQSRIAELEEQLEVVQEQFDAALRELNNFKESN